MISLVVAFACAFKALAAIQVVSNSTVHDAIESIEFYFYRQIRVHERFTGLSIAEPVHDSAHRLFRLHLDAKMMARSKRNLETLLGLCEDDDERLVSDTRRNTWNNLIRLSEFKYHVFYDDLATTPSKIDDVDNIVANVFMSNHELTLKNPPVVLIVLSFPELIKSHLPRVELLRTLNSAAMFLCCCGQEMKGLKAPPCGCSLDTNTCSKPCMFHQTPSGGLFYHRALQVVQYIKTLHPDSTLWLSGFGLCGGLASLLTQAFYNASDAKAVSAVTFHAPGDFWFAKRQSLYSETARTPNPRIPIHNIGISSNPIFVKNIGSAIHTYGFLYYQTFMRTGVDCIIPTLGEKMTGYHSIRYLEGAVKKLSLGRDEELPCHIAGYTEATRECSHYKYVQKDVPANYLRVMGGSP